LITLAMDTCEARGSVALWRDREPMGLRKHETVEDYSTWLLPQVNEVLTEARLALPDVGLFVVATGPGSFTGLRVGITSVKAWAELFGTKVVGVSRLEAIARAGGLKEGLVAASFDAQRGQLFGGLCRIGNGGIRLVEQEMVIVPSGFVKWVGECAGAERVRWVTLDPSLLEGSQEWRAREEELIRCDVCLAELIGEIGEERAATGHFTDALRLDANYVRRSDAEIFWKG
jgi:tRNA threonylcarbamoyl adenosine modification protein YeaZ